MSTFPVYYYFSLLIHLGKCNFILVVFYEMSTHSATRAQSRPLDFIGFHLSQSFREKVVVFSTNAICIYANIFTIDFVIIIMSLTLLVVI